MARGCDKIRQECVIFSCECACKADQYLAKSFCDTDKQGLCILTDILKRASPASCRDQFAQNLFKIEK